MLALIAHDSKRDGAVPEGGGADRDGAGAPLDPAVAATHPARKRGDPELPDDESREASDGDDAGPPPVDGGGGGPPPGGGRGSDEDDDDDANRAERAGKGDEAGSAGADDSPESGERLLPVGNPPRVARGAALVAVGSLIAFVVMAISRPLRWGVPIGGFGVLVATVGVLDILGSFDDPEGRVGRRVDARALLPGLGLLAGGTLGLCALVTLAVAGYMPVWALAIAVPTTFMAAVVGVWRIGADLGAWSTDGVEAGIWRRHGFWLVTISGLLNLPMLGSKSLTDPWETHYGEVAREILARNDWISLWWAQDGWFWSKPVLDFWLQALAMSLFGVRYQPGQMLANAAHGLSPWPEWAVRMPIYLLTLLCVYLLYKGVAKAFGRRAGLLAGVVLMTMPQWFLVTQQTVTDMPFVAPMAACMGLFLMGALEDPSRIVSAREIGFGSVRVRVSLYHLVVGAVILAVLPQALYLLSRNLEIRLDPLTVRAHLDAFSSGSPQNCGLPGNEACRAAQPVLRGLHPALQALVWIQALAIFLYVNWGERRRARLLFHAAWLFAAIATMGKGPAGLLLPGLCAVAWLVITRRHKDFLRIEIVSGLLLFSAVALPWFVAMYARHGQPFTDRLLFHDMFKRAFTHVHDTNEGDDVGFRYYVWQLGYATFPWVGLAPAALLGFLRRREHGDTRGEASVFFALWFVLGFALFSLMLTKFHHYVLPAVAPIAVLIGVFLDDLIETRVGEPPSNGSGDDDPASGGGSAWQRRALFGAVALVGALLVLLVGRDLAQDREGLEGAARLLHLFVYNYRRPWPPNLDFSVALWVFTGAAAVATALFIVPSWRRAASFALGAVAVAFAAWGIDVYFVKTSPHWGQRETIAAYERVVGETPGPLVAYQMNWKGENFYTGNRIPAFVSSGKKFQDWILEEKKKGTKTFYFLTEHGRTGSLSNELGSPRVFEKLTTPELCNKFVLVRARFD